MSKLIYINDPYSNYLDVELDSTLSELKPEDLVPLADYKVGIDTTVTEK